MADITADHEHLRAERAPGRPWRASTGLFAGIAFCLVYVILIRALAPFLDPIDFAPDAGFAHYFWKLPEPSFWARVTAWTGYILHQVAIWACIYLAQQKGLKYSDRLHPLNYAALGLNALFILAHLLQTHLFYDGLAQDTHIATSQGSVVVMLVMILIMENQRRGLAFGVRAPLGQEVMRVLRKYHGYVFSWALIYTFWYHPMESTSGHLVGTLYTTLIMVQGSLFFTRVHVNRWWTMFLEVMVLFHGTMVAIMHGKGAWAQFGFGFAAMFIVTQMHGLGLSKPVRWAFIAAYLGGIAVTYAFFRPLSVAHEIFRVPATLYALVFLFAAIVWGILAVATRRRPAAA
jgi:hypothetical protein